ncbi:hypothetical protein [Blastococcus saxobsidens]|uniref:Uncharacterized protein n=1 Tax=Blastococcus saxobsidens TaxID=138336 RepID=A0A4Q7Y140_9ACTN|nr:hypothetical protein [Blastococcus saxobsidens]RZU30482.1 hypothetical protein BKA19_0098 [Blastococcus saxobsidens]
MSARTPLPCPPWCEYEPGHGFDSAMPGGGELVRFHGRNLGEHLTVVAEEQAASERGPVTATRGPYLDISAEGPFTAEEARQLAAGIESAVEFLAGLR